VRHYWVDRVVELTAGKRAVGVKSVALSEDEFDSHFPGNPVLPGIYLLEGLAQTAGVLLERTSEGRRLALMGSISRARFPSFARPGDRVVLTVELEALEGDVARIRGSATVGDREVAAAVITFRLVDPDLLIPPVYRPLWQQTMAVWRGEYPELRDG
jgi:3-hydroxyacyl-[acyl-carrier-protein] dehydratase